LQRFNVVKIFAKKSEVCEISLISDEYGLYFRDTFFQPLLKLLAADGSHFIHNTGENQLL